MHTPNKPCEFIPPEVIEKWKVSGIDNKELDGVLVTIASYCVEQLDKKPGREISMFIAITTGAEIYQQLLFAGLSVEPLLTFNKRMSESFKAHLKKLGL